MGPSMSSEELERSQRALYQAQDRIAELTNAQLRMSGTWGSWPSWPRPTP